jgi:hypothetical protein
MWHSNEVEPVFHLPVSAILFNPNFLTYLANAFDAGAPADESKNF